MSHAPTPVTTMAELTESWPAAREVLARRGMACVGCAMAPFETIAEAAAAYGFEPGELIDEVTARPESGVLSGRTRTAARRPRHRARPGR